MDPATLALALLLGIAAGTASGLFGVGGGVIVVPGLVAVASLAFFDAKAASLLAMSIGGIAGIWRHHTAGKVDFRVGLALGAGGAVAAFASVFAIETLAEGTVQAAFGVFLVLVGLRLVLPFSAREHLGNHRHAIPVAILVGAGAGILGAAFGVGGGILMVPVLVVAGVRMHVAVATSLVAVVLVGAAASVAHLAVDPARYGPVLLTLGLPIAAGSLVGARFGAGLAQRIDADHLRWAFGAGVMLVGAWTVYDALSTSM